MATGTVEKGRRRLFQTERAFQRAFWVGFLLIPVVKLVAQGAPIIGGFVAAALGILIMGFYRSEQTQVRPPHEHPRLGDEVYYLGLLYTLTSLCAALVTLFLLQGTEQTLERRTDEMIGSFGIALLTTMAGIVLRMDLQGHAPEDQDVDVSRDLERYARELRRQLESSANAFASHANKTILQAKTTHAHMDELMHTFHRGLEEKAKAELARLQALHESAADSAEQALRRTEAQQEGIHTALRGFQAQVTAMDESIERIRVGSEATATHLGTIGALAEQSVKVGHDWVTIQHQANGAMGEMQQTTRELATLGHEAQRTSAELAALPDGLRTATAEVEKLTEATTASKAMADLEVNATAVARNLAAIADAGQLHHEAIGAAVEKLQALAETASQDFAAQGQLKEAIVQLAEVAATAASYTQSLKGTLREVQGINSELKSVQTALRDEGTDLATQLRAAIAALEEARRSDSAWKRFFGG